MNNSANNLFTAVDMILDHKLQNAKFDISAIAVVLRNLESEANSNKYEIRYEDSVLEAYAAEGVKYNKGDAVFVLFAQNRLEANNWILGAAHSARLALEKSELIDVNYLDIGETIVTDQPSKEEDLIKVNQDSRIILWNVNAASNKITIDATAFRSYASQGNFVKVAAEFQTKDLEGNGNYGLEIIITEDEVERKLILDTTLMIGNFYNFSYPSKQVDIFALGSKDVRIKQVALFTKGFTNGSVTISNIDIKVAQESANSAKNQIEMELLAPSGATFIEGSESIENGLQLRAWLVKNEKPIINNLECYWFKQNPAIQTGNEKFHAYGGPGWELLNNSSNGVLDTNDFVYQVGIKEVNSKSALFKAVIIFEGNKYQSTVTIYNGTAESSSINIIKTENQLECRVEPSNEEYSYQWCMIDTRGYWAPIEGSVSSIFPITSITAGFFGCVVNDNEKYIGFSSIELYGRIENIKDFKIEYAYGDSNAVPPEEGWQLIQPDYQADKYLWQRVTKTYLDDRVEVISACINSPSTDAYVINMSNDTVIVSGEPESDVLKELTLNTVTVWHGSTDITEQCDFYWNVTGAAQAESNEKKNVSQLISLINDNAQIIVTVTFNSTHIGSATQTVSRIYNGKDAINYKLIISPNMINWSKTKEDVEVFFTVLEISNESKDITNSFNEKDLAIYFNDDINGIVNSSYTINHNESLASFKLKTSDGLIRDQEDISIVQDGAVGEQGIQGEEGPQGPQGEPALPADKTENVRVYLKTNQGLSNPPSIPSNGLELGNWNISEPIPDSDNAYVWTSMGIKVSVAFWTDSSKTSVDWVLKEYTNWTTPELWTAYGAENINNQTYATFLKLMNGKEGGVEYDENGQLYIKASFIQSNSILVVDDNGNTVFSATADDADSVKIGGFTVKGTQFYSNEKTAYDSNQNGVYIGNEGIGLGKGSFYVTSDGYLYSNIGSIGKWEITKGGLNDGIKVGMLTDGRGVHTSSLINSSAVEPAYGYVRFYAGAYSTPNEDSNHALGVNGKRTIYTEIADFYVTDKGYLYANNIQATGGKIAGLNIGQKGKGLALYNFINEAAPLQNDGDLLIAPFGATIEDLTGEIDKNDIYYFGLGKIFTIGSDGKVTCGSIDLKFNNQIIGRIVVNENSIDLQGTWTLNGNNFNLT